MSSPAPSRRQTDRFVTSLRAAPLPVIMEVKRHDGHGADLLAGRTATEVVAEYEAAGAPCLSVVTGHWFGGSLAMLEEVRAATSLPLLQKDFLTSSRHLRRAADLGVDAVLLTAALLARSTISELVDEALGLGLLPFVETSNEAEIAAVPQPAACIIAVNNKDISRREAGPADHDRSLTLLPCLEAAGAGCTVSASGVDSPARAAELIGSGFDGVLVGRSVLLSGDAVGWADAARQHRRVRVFG